MSHSLGAKLSGLRHKGYITDDEYLRLKKALEQQPCDDAISRILTRMWNCRGKHTTSIDKVKMEQIIRDELPSVTRQAGEWIVYNYPAHECVYCSKCKTEYYECDLYLGGSEFPNFCPNCGAKMQESE